jgi:hypothetical protein
VGVLARMIAAELTPMYVRDGTSESFEPVDIARIVEHVLIVAAREHPHQGAVEENARLRRALTEIVTAPDDFNGASLRVMADEALVAARGQ